MHGVTVPYPVCSHCGQRLLLRHGVQLSPLLADIFDMVERSDTRGITCEVLCGVFYPGRPRAAAKRCMRVNIDHLNIKLAETEIEVRAARSSRQEEPYRVQRKVKRKIGQRRNTAREPYAVRKRRK
jgi:hypothetical protein